MNMVEILLVVAVGVLVGSNFVAFKNDVQADVEFTQRCQVRGGAMIETTSTRYCIDQHVVSLEEPK